MKFYKKSPELELDGYHLLFTLLVVKGEQKSYDH